MPTSKFTFSNALIGWQKQLGIALLHLLSGYVINHNFTSNNIVCTFWPGSGLALAWLLIGGRRYVAGVILGSLLLNVLSNDSLLAIGGITLVNVLEPLFGVWLLTRNNQSTPSLRTLRDYLRLIILGGGVACIAGAFIGGLAILLADYITPVDYFGNVLRWWMGDTLGVVLVTPLILIWGREKLEKVKAKQLLQGLLLIGITFLVGQIVFLDWFHEYLSETPKAYWMFICVTWTGIRMGNRGVTFVMLMIAIQALLGAYYEIGFFAHEIARANLYNYWAYLLILSIVGMTIATYVNEIKEALGLLQLKDSALNAAANSIVITDTNGRIEWANQAFSRLTGVNLSDAYGLTHSELVKSGKQDGAYYQSMWETIFTNKVWRGELVNRRKDGTLYDEEMTITPLVNEQGEITHFVAVKQEVTERKQMELQLIESELQYRILANSGQALIWTADTDKLRDYFNKVWLEFTGRSMQQERGNGWVEGVHPDDFQRCLDVYTSSFDRREKFSMDYRLRRHDGEYRWIQDDGCPRYNSAGEFIGYIGYCFDITERKRMEEKLRDSDAFNVSILNSLTSHIAVLDAQGVIVAVNNAWRRFAKENGLSEANQNMLGFNYLDACKNAFNQPYGDEANAALTGIAAVLAGEQEAFYLEYPCHSPTQQRWFQMNVSPLQGSRRGAVVSHANITPRKQAEVALQESENRYRALVQDASDAILIADMHGNLEEINRAGELLLGYSRDQISRMSVVQIHPADEQAKVRQHFEGVATKGSTEPIETKILRQDGRLVDVEIRPTLSEIGGRKVAQATFIDLTEHNRIEKERLEREKAQRDALVREVHHRIKNNLQGIIGILRSFADSHPETAELLNYAISQVQSVAVIHGLQGRSSLANIRVCELTVAIAAGIESMWEMPVTVEIPDWWIPYIIAEAEAVPLALVLNELICNAVKHGEADGHVRIMLSHEPHSDSIRLTIHNTGLIPAGIGLENTTTFSIGLQLVASLLPRTGANLTWAQQGGIVVTTLDLDKPIIQLETVT